MIRLEYLKGSKETAIDAGYPDIDTRLWNVLYPVLPGYEHTAGAPTLGVQGLRERGLI